MPFAMYLRDQLSLNSVKREEMSKLLPRKKTVSTVAEAVVLQLFDIKVPGKKLKVAGCRVTSGSLLRKNRVQGA